MRGLGRTGRSPALRPPRVLSPQPPSLGDRGRPLSSSTVPRCAQPLTCPDPRRMFRVCAPPHPPPSLPTQQFPTWTSGSLRQVVSSLSLFPVAFLCVVSVVYTRESPQVRSRKPRESPRCTLSLLRPPARRRPPSRRRSVPSPRLPVALLALNLVCEGDPEKPGVYLLKSVYLFLHI